MRLLLFLNYYVALPLLLFSASCLAWGYHHPAAIRLPTDKPTTSTTSKPPPPNTTKAYSVPSSTFSTSSQPETTTTELVTTTVASSTSSSISSTSTAAYSSRSSSGSSSSTAKEGNPVISISTSPSAVTPSSSTTTEYPTTSIKPTSPIPESQEKKKKIKNEILEGTTTQIPTTTSATTTTTTERTTISTTTVNSDVTSSASPPPPPSSSSASTEKEAIELSTDFSQKIAEGNDEKSKDVNAAATDPISSSPSLPSSSPTTIKTMEAQVTQELSSSTVSASLAALSTLPAGLGQGQTAASSVETNPVPVASSLQHQQQPQVEEQPSIAQMAVVSKFTKEEAESSSTSTKQCLRNESEVSYWEFGDCAQNCTSSADCNTQQNEQCICDGPCGMSCLTPDLVSIYCDAPGPVENGKALVVGELGLYDYRNQLQRFMHNSKIIFECDEGFSLIDGPQENICRNGLWFPSVGEPKCVFSDTPGFRWMQSNRVKRRAIKSGGTSSIARNSVAGRGGGGGGGGSRRGRKKGANVGETEDESDNAVVPDSFLCTPLDEDYDQYIQTELITKGNDPNNTDVSEGAVVKVSCTHGFGVNLLNDTITCDERGRWRPKTPTCSPLPCKVPYIAHATFYLYGKPLYFLEVRNHDNTVELRCSRGYVLNGQSKFHCSFGEWDLIDAPECIPSSCDLPQLDRGSYASRFRPGLVVGHGTEVDYHCDGEFQKMPPGGPAKCHLGDWRPNKPACFHPSYINGMKNFTHDKDNRLITSIKRSCGVPRKEDGAIFYVEGKPIDYDTDYIFPDGTEVMYRCAAAKPKPKNRWKMLCEDGQWIGGFSNFTCADLNTTYVANMTSIKDTIRMINSSCLYKKKDTHVVTFMNDQQLTMDTTEFPPGSILINRCIDIGKFKLKGAVRRKCMSGQWLGITPKCEGLSQYYDYGVDKPPTILFRYLNGSIVQTNDGKLMVYPGTTLYMECLYIRKFGRPQWNVSNSHREYPEGWTDGIENRDPTLEYRLTVENADDSDTGAYSCITPSRHGHQIDIIVKKVDCPPLPERSDLAYSTDSTMLGTRVTFQCKDSNSLIGAKDIVCQSSGSWSAPLPKCENVECPDISMVPAMAPLDYSSAARNSSLKRSETAPPKISIMNREVGGKAVFSCAPGYMTEGASEAVCQLNGEWSAPIPVCKEVECPPPPSPQNGSVTGNAPYKAGDLAQFECDAGFMMEGQPIIACQDNGKWSRASSTTKCVKACTYPGTTIGGTISAVKYYYPIGDTVEYDCTEGYDLKGSRMLHCLSTAQWSNSTPICIPKKSSKKK